LIEEKLNQLRNQNGDRQSTFFSNPATFVLGHQKENGEWQVVAESTRSGPVVTCYVSPIHALIQASYLSREGRQIGVKHAGLIREELFRTADRCGLAADLRLAWLVHNGKIAQDTAGNFAAFARRMSRRSYSSTPPVHFELSESCVDQIDKLYERAGLFAWRETFLNVTAWSEHRLSGVVMRAVASMELTKCDISQCMEAAIFDAEFEQWHIVPIDDFIP
jgi:hypothetical protein